MIVVSKSPCGRLETMGDKWLNPNTGVISKMAIPYPTTFKAMENIFNNKKSIIEKYIVQVDADGMAKIIKAEVQ